MHMMRKSLLILLMGTMALAQSVENNKAQPAHSALRLEHADVPLYPQMARVARIVGTVEVQVTVSNGKVVNTELKSSPKGPPLLSQATLDNIQTWRFYKLDSGTFTTKFIYELKTYKTLDSLNSKAELQLPFLAKITAVPVNLDSQKTQSVGAIKNSDTTIDSTTGDLHMTIPLATTAKPQ
jgi:TonB family protein